MDLLREIKNKIEVIRARDSDGDGLDAIVRHVEMAESHLRDGRRRAIPDYFTDAIYRTNQAFEGALKEAYQRLASQDASRKSPSQIERYFQTNQVLKPRVIQLLTNYRQEWRNSSTHDHKLFFDSQEAYLAIVSVSAFASILLDQIVESRAFHEETERLQSEGDLFLESAKVGKVSLVRSLGLLLESYGGLLNRDGKSELSSGLELYGRVLAFLKKVAPSAVVEQDVEVRLHTGALYRADFVINRNGESALLEVKFLEDSSRKDAAALAKEQMASLLRSYEGPLAGGAVFLVSKSVANVAVEQALVRHGRSALQLIVVSA